MPLGNFGIEWYGKREWNLAQDTSSQETFGGPLK